jgi:hypothetical protein
MNSKFVAAVLCALLFLLGFGADRAYAASSEEFGFVVFLYVVFAMFLAGVIAMLVEDKK